MNDRTIKIKGINKVGGVFIVPGQLVKCDDMVLELLDRLNIFYDEGIVPSLSMVHRWLLDFGIFISVERYEDEEGVSWSSDVCEDEFFSYDEALKAGILIVLCDDELLKEKGLLKVNGLRKIAIKYKGGDIAVPGDNVLRSGGLTIMDHDVKINVMIMNSDVEGFERIGLKYEFELDRRGYELDIESNSIVLSIPSLGDIIKD